jgi:hypothetical protein
LDLACTVDDENRIPAGELAQRAGFTLSANGKTNVGLGRPLAMLKNPAEEATR